MKSNTFFTIVCILLLSALVYTLERFEDYKEKCDLTCPELGYETEAHIRQLEMKVEQLEIEADIYGDTWRESDCGIQISEEQKAIKIVYLNYMSQGCEDLFLACWNSNKEGNAPTICFDIYYGCWLRIHKYLGEAKDG